MKLNLSHFLILLSFVIFYFNCKEKSEYVTDLDELIEFVNSKEFEERAAQQAKIDEIPNSDECLVPKDEAIEILERDYGIITSDPSDNLRFIVGKCNPVILIPGIYGTKMKLEINCKGISENERDTTLKEIRVFCGDTICKDEDDEHEEHAVFVALFDKSFTIVSPLGDDKYSSCLGYFMNYFQNEKECPIIDGKSICNYSPYIKVGYFGCTTDSESDSRCGITAIQNIIQSGYTTVDNIINIGAAKSYETMSNKLKKRGYQEGFSYGGIPNDYRRFIATNNFTTEAFRYQVNTLYANTGKPVVIVGHSYGTLVTLTNLLMERNKDLLPKIKKFIAVAPPFAGSSKLLDVFFHGMDGFNKEFDIFGKKIVITNYNIFGQNMMYKSLPTLTELRPLSIAAKILTDNKYKELGKALKERISYEIECKNQRCEDKSTNKFDHIFKGYFPVFSDEECEYEETSTLNRKCFTNIYNIGECPTILTKSTSENPYGDDVEIYCGQKRPEFYYQGECNSGNKNCLDELYSEKCPYVYDNKEAVDFLLERYNSDFAEEFGEIDRSYFETFDHIKKGKKESISYHDKIDIIKDLPPPPVDTDLVYASFLETYAALVMNEQDFTQDGDIYNKGGDGTVPTWSSLLTGFKWIYEKKMNNLTQNYKLVEYCSRLGKSGKYKFNPEIEQSFIALGCSCLDKDNTYKDKTDDCSHASMINDDVLIDYIFSVVDDPKEKIEVTDSKREAARNYIPEYDYESQCNYELKKLLEESK